MFSGKEKYESPIEGVFAENLVNEIISQEEIAVMSKVKMYIDVDKDELIKALKYDRDQYDKGFNDGYSKGLEDGEKRMFERLKKFVRPRGEDND